MIFYSELIQVVFDIFWLCVIVTSSAILAIRIYKEYPEIIESLKDLFK